MRKLFRVLVWITVICFSLILGFAVGQAALPPADRERVELAIEQTVAAWPTPTPQPTHAPIVVTVERIVNREVVVTVTNTPRPATPTPEPVETTSAQQIDYQIVEINDISVGATKRMRYTLQVSNTPSREGLIRLARIIVEAKHMNGNPVNAVTIFVYPDFVPPEGIVDATVIWAPNGVWADADNVRTGDYSKHQYTVDFYDPRPTPSGDSGEVHRRTIFQTAGAAQAEANKLTETKRKAGDFKDLDEEIEFSQAALRAANRAVMEMFDITEDEFYKIIAEGIEKKW